MSHMEQEARQAARARARKKHRRRQITGIGCSVFLLIILVSAIALGFRLWQINENTRAMEVDKNPAISIDIDEGMGVRAIGQRLEKKGIISNARTFYLYVKLKGAGGDIKAGHHNFTKDMPLRKVVEELKNSQGGGQGVVKILIREGLTIDQMAKEIAKVTNRPAKDFIKAVDNPKTVAAMKKAHPKLLASAGGEGVLHPLEGYLFPATYEYNLADTDFSVLIGQMVSKTDEVMVPFYDEIKAQGKTVNSILTMASLIEKEGNTANDRKLISSVFYNRLDADMPIQSDITVLYALGTHKEVVTHKDLEVDSPYNLYKNTGLAPGPMNNPSQEAIDAAVHPAESDYLYFFANLKNGKVYFTADFDEHLAWQEEYAKNGTVNGE